MCSFRLWLGGVMGGGLRCLYILGAAYGLNNRKEIQCDLNKFERLIPWQPPNP
jgi:hypothetical protein